MKKILLFLGVVAVISIAAVLNSCEEDAVCKTSTSVCGTFEACCTSTDCYYLYDGKTYDCDGTDCDAAALELATDMCNKSGSESISQQLILEQTSMLLDAICNWI